MSSFLAPIHFWLYDKINAQEELVRDIASFAKSKGYIQDAGEYSAEPLPELSVAIDLGNIHGWLQEKIEESERRLARLVTDIVRADETRLSAIEEAARAFGSRHAVPKNADAQDAHKAVNDLLVNGMPCDTVESVTESASERVAWKSTADLHAPYWTQIGGKGEHYWKIRAAVIGGMLSGSSLEFTAGGNSFEITRK